jgi:hypothetical protein
MHSSFEMIGVTASCRVSPVASLLRRQAFRSTHTASLSGARRNRRRFQGLASRAVASDGKTRRCRLCRGTARPPSLEVSRTAAQHLKKRSRSTGRSRHATVSSPNMSRVNFNVPSYANSSKSRLVKARRPALCKSQALRLPSSAITIVTSKSVDEHCVALFFACDLTDPPCVHRGFLAATAA